MATLPAIPLAGPVSPCESEPCSQCCHDIEMILTDDDMRRLRAATGRSDLWFQAEDGFMQLRTRDGPPARGSPGGRPCVLLGDDGLCTVWADRPEGCRLYPAVWDDAARSASLDADYCPHTDGFRLAPAVGDAAKRLVARLEAEAARRASAMP